MRFIERIFIVGSLLFCAICTIAQNRVVYTGSTSRQVINLNDTAGGGSLSIWEQLEQERLEQERAEQERLLQEQERLAVEKREQEEKAEQERLAAEQRAKEAKAEQERLAAEKALQKEQERLAAEQRTKEAKAEQERLAAEKALQKEQERLAAEQRAQAEKAERERLFLQRQTYQDSVRALKKDRFVQWKESCPMSHILMANGSFALYPEYAFGLTYGQVHICGWYVNAMLNANIHTTSTNIYSYEYTPFYTGKQDAMRLSATIGGIVRLYIPMYFYAGIGYGYRAIYFEDIEHNWIRQYATTSAPYHGVHWELGLMGNIKGFSLSAGLSAITGKVFYMASTYYEAKIGIGCFINQKEKQ